MTTGYVVDLDNGHNGYCVESLVGVTYCGETFDPAAVDRELYAIDRGEDHPHNYLCYDCSKADSRKIRGAVRGETA
ncbi:hypothetical protein NP511_01975 [Natrinema thermotolerans]|uniref:Uncharacterized protein n=1 Tax=Natrinema thermotolerans TaxID=121872 RepID=A0AAF0PC32_9EURY|nr:hypothetical protein [Natrinema thermotolerans]WPH65829.1 hypothetical protein HJTV4_gp5 [Haloarchaeal virus HJTV-4]QCC60734.1 hypothetical protein DVR14_19670 [Natrinema thermotolerans]QCC61612.1 hypothetical protein DVR14_23800 [Natrinema thermotolerans]WMT07778.1 hypothetical protein NP511_20690 [Natrinema thermotolerans]WMT08410.1 hypothetical protein NP511_01975 [Natrinema thermotolerans]